MLLLLLLLAPIALISAKSIKVDQKPFELDEFLTGAFATKTFNGSWITDDSFLYTNDSNYYIYNVDTKETNLFLDQNVLKSYPGASISLSHDQLFVLIRFSVSSVFRHSTTAKYTIYNINDKTYHIVANNESIQIAKWAPIGHGLAYVFKNDIYYLDTPSAVLTPIRITNDGVDGVLYNGVPDWVYEEEVLGTGLAFWFSPSGAQLAFASFHDEAVPSFQYPVYGASQYPAQPTIRYPKVGATNPTVHVYVAALAPNAAPRRLPAPAALPANDTVFYDAAWVGEAALAVAWASRAQDRAHLLRCDAAGAGCEPEAAYAAEGGWLDVAVPLYGAGGAARLEVLPQAEGGDWFSHLVLTEVGSGRATRLTRGRMTVTGVNGWDEEKKIVYYSGSGVDAPWEQHVYQISTDTLISKCLTCDWKAPDEKCEYAAATFSKKFTNIARICQGPKPQLVLIEKTAQLGVNSLVWEDNAALSAKLEGKLVPKVKNLQIKTDNGFNTNVRIYLPPDLDENGTKKYPAIVNVYGGPDSNQIRNSYSAGLQNYWATNRGYIYILIDGRGSGRDGNNKKFQIYKKMATVEIEDQITSTKYLQDNLSYIDANKTAIWGWSYGGFATAWVLAQDTQHVFKCGLSVAPVTNFFLYDSIYTERYMGLLEDNEAGYNRTDVTRNPKAFEGKSFFLIHGNADDNVHYQNSMLLAKALELADVQFQQQSYPDEAHSLAHVSPHLYHTIDRFWARCFDLPDPVIKHIEPKNDQKE